MSNELGFHTFIPWLRRGLAAQINKDHEATQDARASFDVQLHVTGGSISKDPDKVKLQLYGPGDIINFDGRAVLRHWPGANVHEVEPNYFPLLEFDQPDLPWRYSPVAPAAGRLLPWLCLIALRDEEIEAVTESHQTGRLGSVKIKAQTPMPDLAQSWAWAHVHVVGTPPKDSAAMAGLLAKGPNQVVARLLCPRRLDPKVPYRVFLVPTFLRGMAAGLRQPQKDPGITSAWTKTVLDATLELPVFYQWRFTTSVVGDFEYLVRQLQPRPVPSTVGVRPIDASNPGSNLPSASDEPLQIAAALVPPKIEHKDDWDSKVWMDAIIPLLNRAAELESRMDGVPVVGPPLYGRWPAHAKTIDAKKPPWFQDLNSDLRLRTVAGLGTQVVQENQQQLMASAWKQVDKLREINAELRATQLARELSLSIYERHVGTASVEGLLALTAPVHGLILGESTTMRAQLRASPIGRGVFESQFRRLSRRNGPLGRRQGRAGADWRSSLLNRLNNGSLSAADAPTSPQVMTTMGRAGKAAMPGRFDQEFVQRLVSLPKKKLLAVAIILLLVAILLAWTGKVWFLVVPLVALALALLAALVSPDFANQLNQLATFQFGALTPEQIAAIPPRPDFMLTRFPLAEPRPPSSFPDLTNLAVGQDNAVAAGFRGAAMAAFAELGAKPSPGALLRPVDLGAMARDVFVALDPNVTIGARVGQRLQLSSGILPDPDDALEPVMAAPDFPQPMYKPLSDFSADWLLPGLKEIPQNTITLLETNDRFIEAYMVGLSHEMARTLLYNGYPTDQRGTYFRQFWKPAGAVDVEGKPVDAEQKKDILPIHLWERNSKLGDHPVRQSASGDQLVLLIRGELLRRYPNASIHATKAVLNVKRERAPDGEERPPLFSGSMEPDVTFLGFDLTLKEAMGDGGQDLGWFFVIEEPVAEPRFGLDTNGVEGKPATNWQDLSWGNLAEKAEDVAKIGYINLGDATYPITKDIKPLPQQPEVHFRVNEGARSADIAYATRRLPFRVAIHASQMLADVDPQKQPTKPKAKE